MFKQNALLIIIHIFVCPSNFVCRFSEQSVFFSWSGSIVKSALNRERLIFSARAKLFGLSQPPQFSWKIIFILKLSTGSSLNKMQSYFENLKVFFFQNSHFLFRRHFNFEFWRDCLLCILRILICHVIFSSSFEFKNSFLIFARTLQRS